MAKFIVPIAHSYCPSASEVTYMNTARLITSIHFPYIMEYIVSSHISVT